MYSDIFCQYYNCTQLVISIRRKILRLPPTIYSLHLNCVQYYKIILLMWDPSISLHSVKILQVKIKIPVDSENEIKKVAFLIT